MIILDRYCGFFFKIILYTLLLKSQTRYYVVVFFVLLIWGYFFLLKSNNNKFIFKLYSQANLKNSINCDNKGGHNQINNNDNAYQYLYYHELYSIRSSSSNIYGDYNRIAYV